MLINKQTSNNLLGLLSCLLAVVFVCLTGFNLYLLTWIWSATSGLEQDPSSSSLNFVGKLHARQSVSSPSVRLINLHEGHLQISSQKSVHFGSSLILSGGQEKKIKFPYGLKVRALNSSKAQIHCDPIKQSNEKAQQCHLRSPRLKLTNSIGVDLSRNSIQSPKVFVRRLHSPTNKLNMMSSRQSTRLESLSGRLELYALEDIHLGSKNSTVILDSKSIELSPRLGQSGKNDAGYKLCICLDDNQPRPGGEQSMGADVQRNSINNNGRVFAVASDLKCFKFTPTFCNNK